MATEVRKYNFKYQLFILMNLLSISDSIYQCLGEFASLIFPRNVFSLPNAQYTVTVNIMTLSDRK